MEQNQIKTIIFLQNNSLSSSDILGVASLFSVGLLVTAWVSEHQAEL